MLVIVIRDVRSQWVLEMISEGPFPKD